VENNNHISYETIQQILNLVNTGLIIIDEDGIVIVTNEYFTHTVCNTHIKSFHNINISSIQEIPQEIKRLILLDNTELLESKKANQYSTTITVQGNTQLSFRIIKTWFEEKNKKYILTLFVDISQEVAIYKELKKSERKYRYLLDYVPLGLLTLDASTLKIIDTNRKALELLRFSEYTHLIGKYLPDVLNVKESNIYELIQSKWESIENYECKLQYGEEERYLRMNFAAITLDDTNSYLVTLDDVTPLKKAQEELTISHGQVKHLLSAIDSILIGVSRNDIITHWNRTAEKIFGINSSDAVGKNIIGFNIPWEWNKIYMGITASIVEKRPITLPDVRYDSLYGQKRLLGITINPIMDEDGTLLGYLIFGRDITDKRISESEMVQAQELQSIGQLAAGIAHEINTPAQYVNDNLHFIKDVVLDLEALLNTCDELTSVLFAAKQLPQRLQKLLNEINTIKEKIDYTYCKEELPKAVEQSIEGISKIVSIVKSLKNFAHPDTQKKVIINLNKTLEDVITITRNEWKYISDLTTDFKHIDIMIPCFPNQLNQVFLNMIINARDAIQEAIDKKLIEKGNIEISTDMNTDYAIVAIKDNGIGISEEIKSKIFDPFFTTKEVGKGSGQGLAIAHSIIYDKHKGMIRVESEYGKGTTFYVYLPLRDLSLEL